jgi:hypothetical protein
MIWTKSKARGEFRIRSCGTLSEVWVVSNRTTAAMLKMTRDWETDMGGRDIRNP